MSNSPTPPDAATARGLWLEYALREVVRDWPRRYRIARFRRAWKSIYGVACPLSRREMVAALAQVADLADQGEAR